MARTVRIDQSSMVYGGSDGPIIGPSPTADRQRAVDGPWSMDIYTLGTSPAVRLVFHGVMQLTLGPKGRGYHCIPCHETAPTRRAQTELARRLWPAPASQCTAGVLASTASGLRPTA